MDLTSFLSSPASELVTVGLLLTIVVLAYLAVHFKIKTFLAGVQEDLVNTYTPEILKPRTMEGRTESAEQAETVSAEEEDAPKE